MGWTASTRAQVLADHRAGVPAAEIGAKHGRTPGAIRSAVHRWLHPPAPKPMGPIRREQRELVDRLVRLHGSLRAAAAACGVAASSLCRARKGRVLAPDTVARLRAALPGETARNAG